ncbi:caspase fold protease [Cryptosporidium ryanae]|uniref:caspase fold protease n=1 Tax=Cryptosporidium ryanae TaxID=515981 RepID=UPI00351A22E8|nr:caspase fold protease [Cryptosporidium ryanae]
MTEWRIQVHNLFERKKFNELLSISLTILSKKIEILLNNDIDVFKSGTKIKFDQTANKETFRKIIVKIGSDSNKIKIENVLSELLYKRDGIEWKRIIKSDIDNAMLCFEDINKIFSYISVCCAKIGDNEIIISYIQLFHKIMPYFIIGDFFFLHINGNRKWNTEKIFISSVLKLSEKILENKNIEFNETDFRYSYLLWEVCLCNWLKYSGIRMEYSEIPENIGNEILCLLKNLIEIFQLLCKSSLKYHQKASIVYSLWRNIFNSKINTSFYKIGGIYMPSKSNDLGVFAGENHIINILKNKIFILLDKSLYEDILDILTYFNIFTGLILGIVHKYIKQVSRSIDDTLLHIEHIDIPPEISVLFEEHNIYHQQLMQKDVVSLHILKIELCLINCVAFEKTIERFDNLCNQQTVKSEIKLNKEIICSFFLTIGVVNSLSDLNFNEKLLIVVKDLLYCQHNSLSKVFRIGEINDFDTFLRNIDGYSSCLIENVFKKITNRKCESEIDETLKRDVATIIIEILSMLCNFIENFNKESCREKLGDVSQFTNITIRLKTFICEAIIRYIHYMEEINDEYFLILEQIFESLLLDKIPKDNKVDVDELVLGFILSISENLLRLSSQLKQKRNFQGSIKISTFGLITLSNIISIPWVAQSDIFLQKKKKYQDIRIIDDTDEFIVNNINPLSTPKNTRSFPQPFETMYVNVSKIETATRFWETPSYLHNKSIYRNIYLNQNNENFDIDTINTPTATNANIGSMQTPFTARLRNRSISQIKSQTIKRIQMSTLNNYRIMNRTVRTDFIKLEDDFKNEDYYSKLESNDSPDYPIHVLLFMLMLEQLISSINLISNEKEQTKSDFYQIISLIKDNIGNVFSQIDDFSFVFIFNHILEDFSLENEEPFKSILNFDWFSKMTLDKRAILMKKHFCSVILSLVSRFVKVKLLLIERFSVDADIIELFPKILGNRDNVFRIIWTNLELSVYKNCRFGTNKYNKIFKEIVKNGFYNKFIDLFNFSLSFDKGVPILLDYSSKVMFLNLYRNRINLFEFYTWVVNLQKKYFKKGFCDKHSFTDYMHEILNNLESSTNNLNLDDLKREIYLLEILTLKINLILECDFESRNNLSEWCKNSFKINQLVAIEMNKFLGCLSAVIAVNFDRQSFLDDNILPISYWITHDTGVLLYENRNDYGYLNETYSPDHANSEEVDHDVPIPLRNVKNKTVFDKENDDKEINLLIKATNELKINKTKTQSNIKNNVRFAISEDSPKTVSSEFLFLNGNNIFDVSEFKIIIYNVYKMLDIIELQQGIEIIYQAKLLNTMLFFFRHCWVFCISYDKFSTKFSSNGKISNLIYRSLKNMIEIIFNKDDEVINQSDVLLINIGVLISRLLYKVANFQRNNSKNTYINWLRIADLYNKNLIILIEDKYILLETFLGEKLPNSCLGSEAIFKLIVLQIENTSINEHFEIYKLISYINKLELPDLPGGNIINTVLFTRLYRRLSELLFNSTNKLDIPLFLVLECNKFTQSLIQNLDGYIDDIRPNLNLIFSFNGISKSHIISVIIKSLEDLGIFWWKIGEIERSHRIFTKVSNLCREWTTSYNNMIRIFFYHFPILLSLTGNRNNSNNGITDTNNFNCPLDSLYTFNLSYYSIDAIIQLTNSLCDVYCQGLQLYNCKTVNLSTEKFILMIGVYLILYSSMYNSYTNINQIRKTALIYKNCNISVEPNENSAICSILKGIISKIAITENIDIIEIIMTILSLLDSKFDDYYFDIFYANILSYSVSIITSKYIDSVALTVFKNGKNDQSQTSENLNTYFLLNNILDDEVSYMSNPKYSKMNYIANELNKKINQAQKIFFNVTKVDFEGYMDINEHIASDGYKLIDLSSLLHRQKGQNKSFARNKLLKEINDFFDIIIYHTILCIKYKIFVLINNNISIVIDFILLISSLTYQLNKSNSSYSDIVSSLNHILSIFNSSLYIHSMRIIQKKYEHYKKKEQVAYDLNQIKDKSFYNYLKHILSFLLELNKNFEEEENLRKNDTSYRNNLIPRIYIRFSSFFSTFPFEVTRSTKFSLFQITRDISLVNNIKNESFGGNISNSSIPTNLTIFYFIESSRINSLLEMFGEIQKENISSIIDVDVTQKSAKKAKIWWSRRIKLELKFQEWIELFSKVIFRDWTARLLFGFPKKLLNSKNNLKMLNYIDKNLKFYKSLGMLEIILYSLFTNTPNLIDLLNRITKTNVSFSTLYKSFRKTISSNTVNYCIKNYPIIIFPDKLLMNFPIEGIPDLIFQPITRGLNNKVSLYNFNNLMNKFGSKANEGCLLAKECNIYYCINPSGDLPDTEKTIIPAISKLFKGRNCRGMSNFIPETISMMNEINLNSTNLYLFCGHQAGERFIKGESIERGIITEDCPDNKIFNFPPSLLIGCSSSRIRSYGLSEIFCTPLHYLIGGSPFILGVLWDVTDQDIDRFTLSIFDNWFESNLSLLESITLSRRSCKLPLLNGSSCICFGHPL